MKIDVSLLSLAVLGALCAHGTPAMAAEETEQQSESHQSSAAAAAQPLDGQVFRENRQLLVVSRESVGQKEPVVKDDWYSDLSNRNWDLSLRDMTGAGRCVLSEQDPEH